MASGISKKFPILSETAIPFFTFFPIYLYTICGVTSASHDAIYYIVKIQGNPVIKYSENPLFHPHHLLYNWLTRLWINFFHITGVNASPEFLISLFNALFGTLTLCIIYFILRTRLGAGRLFALAGTALPAFSFGFWFYSVNVEVCIPPLFFLFMTLYLLSGEKITPITCMVAGILGGFAILLHQTHFLFVPSVLAALYYHHKKKNIDFIKSIKLYAAVLLPVVIVPYWIVIFNINKMKTQNIWRWLTNYAQMDIFWSDLSLSTLVKAILGFFRAIIGLNFPFAITAVRDFFDRVFVNYSLMDEAFLVRNLPAGAAYLLFGALILLCILFLAFFVRLVKNWRLLEETHRFLIWLALTFFCPYAIFYFFWVPINAEFWIPQTLCLWLIFVALFMPDYIRNKMETTKNLLTLAALLFIINFSGNMYFLRDHYNDFYFQKCRPLQAAHPGDLIIIGESVKIQNHPSQSWNPPTLKMYLLYLTRAKVFPINLYEEQGRPLSVHHINNIRKNINETLHNGNRVFVYKEAIERQFINNLQLIELWNNYRKRWRKIQTPDDTIYLID